VGRLAVLASTSTSWQMLCPRSTRTNGIPVLYGQQKRDWKKKRRCSYSPNKRFIVFVSKDRTNERDIMNICKHCEKERQILSRGLCESCYRKLRRNGEIEKYPRVRKKMGMIAICPGCGQQKELECMGLCHTCYNREYQKAHPEQKDAINARKGQWRAKNPAKIAGYRHKRRSAKRGLESSLTEHQWIRILSIFMNSCAYCGVSGIELEQEHWEPVSRGGPYTAGNIVPACRACNVEKGTMTGQEFIEKRKGLL